MLSKFLIPRCIGIYKIEEKGSGAEPNYSEVIANKIIEYYNSQSANSLITALASPAITHPAASISAAFERISLVKT